MQLKIQRSQQRKTGFFGGDKGVFFSLSVRAEYTAEENANIQKYQIGGSTVFASDIHDENAPSTFITISSLAQGHNIECPSIGQLQKIEKEVIASCKQLQVYLDVANSFDGREILIDFNKPDATVAAE